MSLQSESENESFDAKTQQKKNEIQNKITELISKLFNNALFVSRVLLVKENVWPKYLILNLRIKIVEIRKGGDKTQKLD